MSHSPIPFYDADFLLESEVARALYHEHAAPQPILDYHCHLSPELIANDHRFRSLTEIWLDGDHYKWRALRANGVSESLITGNADDWARFEAWAATVPKTLRNPLYHWTHLELKKPFGVCDRLLSPASAREIYERANAALARSEFSTQGLLRQFGVVAVCTTDDPADDLRHHRAFRASTGHGALRLFPTFRPDKALAIEETGAFKTYIERLEGASGVAIRSYDTLLEALDRRHRDFHDLGCRLSDHGLETLHADDYTAADVANAVTRALAGKAVERAAADRYRSALLVDLARLDHARGWTQQFHLGALRNLNTRMRQTIGPDTGFDSIGDFEIGRPLARFLDGLDSTNQLARTIVYNSNPRDNELVAAVLGCFQDGSTAGKMQYGSAWWFLDQLDGMQRQIDALSNLGLLSQFVGMLTDSRSFLSYSRHEYFRRLLCNLLGRDVQRGLLPDDRRLLGALVADVAFHNARRYFQLELPDSVAAAGPPAGAGV